MRVQTRLVKRYFVEVAGKNKGFATRLGAYKVLAKAELFDTVLGKGEGHYRENLRIPTELGIHEYSAEGAEWQKKRMGELFFEFGFECYTVNEGYGFLAERNCCPDYYAFCAYRYNEWITNRAREMMKEDDNNG